MLTFKKINTIGVTILTILVFLNYFLTIHMGAYIILIIVWFTITSIGSFNIGLNYHLKALNKNPFTKTKQIAITFDDGPNNIYTPQVLKLLESYNAKASFFCIGKHIETHPIILKKNRLDGASSWG